MLFRCQELVIGIVQQGVHKLALKQGKLRTNVNHSDMLLEYLLVFAVFFGFHLHR
jgi:hypothetical protein